VTHDEITCRRLILDCLVDYEDGSMAATERQDFETHLSKCPPCVEFLESYRATGRTLRMLRPREIPPNLADAVMRFVRDRRGRKE
jgi:anti-sigma factor RsiW